MNMLIYQCTHKPTGKYYIGSKKDGEKFLSGEYLTSSKTVREMMKANPEEWTREVHDEFPEEWGWTWQEVVALEQVLIKEAVERDGWDGVWNQQYRPNGHNVYSPEAQAKATKARIGFRHSEETKAKIAAANMGNKRTLGRTQSAEHIEKRASANRGKLRSAETKTLWSQQRLGRKLSEEHREKLRIARKGRVTSEATKQKIARSKIGKKRPDVAARLADIYGESHPTFKGAVIGTNISTGEIIRLVGNKEMKAAGFYSSGISLCISGKLKTHKGYTWTREAPTHNKGHTING